MSIKIKKIGKVELKSDIYHKIEEIDNICLPGSGIYWSNNPIWWVVYDNKDIVGYAGYQKSVNYNNTAYLCRSGILSKYRGLGLQRKLIKSRLRDICINGYSAAITDTTNNIYSSNNLIKCGFTLFIPKYFWGFNQTLYWRREC
jgi:ribosomal protein S18 acetylase RimI-like enzyme